MDERKEIAKDIANTMEKLVVPELKKSNFKNNLKLESANLVEKIKKLQNFKDTLEFYNLDREDKDLLYKQGRIMDEYIQTLGQRMERLDIKDFKK